MTNKYLWDQHAERLFQIRKLGLSTIFWRGGEKGGFLHMFISDIIYTFDGSLSFIELLFSKITPTAQICIREGFQTHK